MSDSFGGGGGQCERNARELLGGVIFWRRYLSRVQTYCLRSIITIASAVRNIISANTPASDSSILIISSSI